MTFTKLFASITESTIWCEDDHTRLVWITMLAMANKNGYVFGSTPGLAHRARVPLPSAIRAISKFLSPDEHSRSPEYEGRRIELVDGGWRLLNYLKHRAICDEEDRKAYKREWARKNRSKPVDTNVDKCGQSRQQWTEAEAEAEAEADKSKIKVKSTVRATFQVPTLEQISNYCIMRGNKVDPQHFLDNYEANGWMVGKARMKNWQAAVRKWERNDFTKPAIWRNGEVPNKLLAVQGLTTSAITYDPKISESDRQLIEQQNLRIAKRAGR